MFVVVSVSFNEKFVLWRRNQAETQETKTELTKGRDANKMLTKEKRDFNFEVLTHIQSCSSLLRIWRESEQQSKSESMQLQLGKL